MPNWSRMTRLCRTSPTEDDRADETSRGHWVGKLDFVLSCIGYGVGIGDLIRFPYIFITNGGGAFLIPFLLFLALCGFPLFYLEASLGQFSSQSCISAWKISPLFKGLGWSMMLVSAILSIYYIMMIVWTMNYLFMSFQATLPWASCNNTWNTHACVRDQFLKITHNVSEAVEVKPHHRVVNWSHIFPIAQLQVAAPKTAAEQYWERRILGISTGVNDVGGFQWQLVLCLFVTWVIVVLCLLKGIRTSGRVVYVTVLAPYFLLLVFLVRGATLSGSWTGVKHFLTPQWHKLAETHIWITAVVQVFFSLGPAWGGLITMASYNRFHDNCFRDAVITTIADGATGLFGGIVISCVLGFMAKEAGVEVSTVVSSGPGLALVAYPEAISKMPFPQIWAVLFFLTLIFLGLDSQFGMFESVVSGLIDMFPKVLKNHRIYLTVGLAIAAFLLGLPFTTQGGMYLYQVIDWYACSANVLFIGVLECIIIGWIYGAGYYSLDIELMCGKRPSTFIRLCWTVITPVLLLICLLSMMATYKAPTYGGYTYPTWSIILSIGISIFSLVPVPAVALHSLVKTPGTLTARVTALLRPDPSWGPMSLGYRHVFNKVLQARSSFTFLQRTIGIGIANLPQAPPPDTVELTGKTSSDYVELGVIVSSAGLE